MQSQMHVHCLAFLLQIIYPEIQSTMDWERPFGHRDGEGLSPVCVASMKAEFKEGAEKTRTDRGVRGS